MTRVSLRETGERAKPEKEARQWEQVGVVDFRDGGRGREARSVGASRVWKRQENSFPWALRDQRGHADISTFSPKGSDFRLPNPCDKEWVFLSTTKHVIGCLNSNGKVMYVPLFLLKGTL